MEMPQQDLTLVFSKMMQMFPNLPKDIVWIYVERYSNDHEKCTQMLNLQSGKYSEPQLPTITRDSTNLNECYEFQFPHLLKSPRTMTDNNNDLLMTENLPLINETDAFINKSTNVNETSVRNKQTSLFLNLHKENCTASFSTPDSSSDFSSNLSKNRNFQEPLSLQISIDEEDGNSHSWRPNLESNLSSDFFLPSPMFESFQFDSNKVPHVASQCHSSDIQVNDNNIIQDERRKSLGDSLAMLQRYPAMPGNVYSIDISSHLHYQKSQMNTLRYEVIKSKIEVGDLNESIEKLSFELKEKLQSKSAQDIEALNTEIIQLRLECQCLCSDVDNLLQDKVLLGELDESVYSDKNVVSKENVEYPNVQTDSPPEQSTEDSSKWQCPKCTFDNHPAINSCEMCHLVRPDIEETQFIQESPSPCFTHPADESVTVTS